MAYSNWAGISGWTVVNDPTSVLNGNTLKAVGGKDADSVEILIQNINTNVSFNIKNYEVVCNYAFQKDTQFKGGRFMILARTSYVGTTVTQYYGAGFDLLRGTVFIVLFNGVTTEVLNIAQLERKYVSREFRHEIKLSVAGTDVVTIDLNIDSERVLSASDVNGVISSGFPAILVRRGTIYIDNFYVNRYTIDGEKPSLWQFSEDFTDFSTQVETWLTTNTGSKTVTSTTDANGSPLSLIDSWQGQDSNSTNATSTGDFRPNKVTRNNYDVSQFFRTVTTRTRGTASNGKAVFYTGSVNNGNLGWYREGTTYITGSSNTSQLDPLAVSFWIKFMDASSAAGNIFTLFDKANYTSGAGANQRSITFSVGPNGTMQFTVRPHDDPSKSNDVIFSASTFSLDTWYNITVEYSGSLYDVSMSNADTKVVVKIDGVQESASSVNTRNPTLGSDYGSTQSANSIMLLSSDPRSSADTSVNRAFISNFIFLNATSSAVNTENPLELKTSLSSDSNTIYVPFRVFDDENQFFSQGIKIFDRKGNVNIENSSYPIAFKSSPKDGACPTTGTGTDQYFGNGLNYRSHIATDKPTGATNGSLFYGRAVTQTPDRSIIPTGSTYNFAEGSAISFSFWLYLDTAISRNPDRIFTAISSSTEVFRFDLKQGIKFQIISVDGSSNSNTLVFDSYTPNTAGWYNIVITWDGTASNLQNHATLYINGVAQTPSSQTINNTSNPLPTVDEFIFFSSDNTGSDAPDDIYVHSIHVFKSELSASNVTSIYNSGSYVSSSSADHQYLFVDDTNNKNLLLDDSGAIIHDYANGNSLSQIANNFVDTGSSNVQAAVTAFTDTALSTVTPTSGSIIVTTTNFPNHLQIAHSTNYNFNSTGCSIFIIGYTVNIVQAEQILLQKGSSYKIKIKNRKLIFDNGSEFGSASTVSITPQLSILSVITNDGIYVNGTKALTLAVGVGSDNTDNIYIGSDESTTESTALKGFIGEVILISRQLDNEDRELVEGFFSHKWGINNLLPSDHPYLTEEPYKGDS